MTLVAQKVALLYLGMTTVAQKAALLYLGVTLVAQEVVLLYLRVTLVAQEVAILYLGMTLVALFVFRFIEWLSQPCGAITTPGHAWQHGVTRDTTKHPVHVTDC